MAKSDRVVVFGGAGFIGSHLVQRLAGNVAEIRVVSRRRLGPSGDGVVHVTADVTDTARTMEVIAGATVVYQLTLESDYLAGARNVADACRAHGVRRLLFASTSDALYLGDGGTIGEHDGPDPYPELRNDYARGKILSERLLLREHAEHGLGVVILRPCVVVGRGGKLAHGGIGKWVSPTCCLGWGDGQNPMPFVLVQDVAEAFHLAMDAPRIEGKAFNLAGDVHLSTRGYVELLRQRTHRNFRFRERNLAWLFATSRLKYGIKRIGGTAEEPDAYRDLKSSAMLSRIDNGPAKRLLGWRPNDQLDTFVREAIDVHVPPLPPGDLRLETTPS